MRLLAEREAMDSVPPEQSGSGATDLRLQKALLERPGISIRTRLILGFLSLFFLSAVVTAAAWVMLSRLEVRLRFLEVADRYTMEIQQARRFEKNYFLYGTGLSDLMEHVENSRKLLDDAQAEAGKVLTASDLKLMQEHLKLYQGLVERLEKAHADPLAMDKEKAGIESDLRSNGSLMVDFALQLAQKERSKVNSTLALFKKWTLVFLVALLGLMVLIANFLARQMLGPLGRLTATAQRIATGDFTPIKPARWYRDEFSDLAVAMNTMMRELQHRHDVLVQSHKLRAVGTLTAGVAHELNNPINNITLTAEMLKEDYPELSDGERLEMVNDLVAQAERAQKIVRNLLDFARESEIKTEKLDLAELLRSTAGLVANQIKLQGAKIELDIPSTLPPIHGDRQSLSQVFLNLLLNALDAVKKGGHVTIKAWPDREKGFIHVAVSDDGCGIPPHVLPNIFDPFFSTKPRGKGTGLGLSVSLGIVRQHGGDIAVESAPEKGSTFTVTLPAALVPEIK
jgi:signal transduction histidine kinase